MDYKVVMGTTSYIGSLLGANRLYKQFLGSSNCNLTSDYSGFECNVSLPRLVLVVFDLLSNVNVCEPKK